MNTLTDEMADRMNTDELLDDLHERIAERIRRYVDPCTIGSVCSAVVNGAVVHVDADVPPGAGIIALRHGILFVPGGEYLVDDGC